MKLKVCGMKHNIAEVAALRPDYLGFIFYENSPRNFEDAIPSLPDGVQRVGVFVDAPIAFIAEKTYRYQLDVLQLHGDESPAYCEALGAPESFTEPMTPLPKIWKVFSVKNQFDFKQLTPYEPFVDGFLFDTKGATKGGTGHTFDWEILKSYASKKPLILSGGIGLTEINQLHALLSIELPIHAVDINSRFEERPGLKKIDELKKFMHEL